MPKMSGKFFPHTFNGTLWRRQFHLAGHSIILSPWLFSLSYLRVENISEGPPIVGATGHEKSRSKRKGQIEAFL
jgi:hypothetical protein